MQAALESKHRAWSFTIKREIERGKHIELYTYGERPLSLYIHGFYMGLGRPLYVPLYEEASLKQIKKKCFALTPPLRFAAAGPFHYIT